MTITRVVILAAGIISMGTSTQLMAGRQESEQPRVIGRWTSPSLLREPVFLRGSSRQVSIWAASMGF